MEYSLKHVLDYLRFIILFVWEVFNENATIKSRFDSKTEL